MPVHRDKVTWSGSTELTELRGQMVDAVIADDCLRRWRAAFTPWRRSLLSGPRHRFIPSTVWVDNDTDPPPVLVPLHREQNPDRWLRLAYAKDGIATQYDRVIATAAYTGGLVALTIADDGTGFGCPHTAFPLVKGPAVAPYSPVATLGA